MIGPESAKGFGASGIDIEPSRYRPHELHQCEAADPVFVPSRPVQAERGAPIVQNQDKVCQVERFDESLEIAGMVLYPICDVRLV